MNLVLSLLLWFVLDTTAVCVMLGYEGMVRGPVCGSQKDSRVRFIQEKVQGCARLYGDKDSD